ncbi:MAG TPA: cell division protein FtsA, partial [Spirochaetota bacterium]|nr:cell division protein FtsA [Spirochaetota bacterium]
MEDIIASLDIGTTKVCVIIARKTSSGVEVIGIGKADSHGLNKGMIVNIEATVKAISQAVEQAEVMSGIEVNELHVGIAGGQIEGINSRGVIAVSRKGGDTEISEDDIARVINTAESVSISQDREIIHVIPQEFIVDDQGGIEDPLGMSGVRLEAEVHLVTCLKSATANIRKAVQRAGYAVADIVLQPIASAEAVLNDDEKELGAVVVDIGGGTSDVLIYKSNSIWFTQVITLGGNNVTKDISHGLRTPIGSAETIKQ